MEAKRLYIHPMTEVCVLHSLEGFMLQASLHDDEADFVGAKENSFDFDDDDPWAGDPWADTPSRDPWE